MSSNPNRLSLSLTGKLPTSPLSPPPTGSEQWTKDWQEVLARDLIDSRIVSVGATTTVEDACDMLLSEGISCLVVKGNPDSDNPAYVGLFDFSDVNAFLTLAAIQHTIPPEELHGKSRAEDIINAARSGVVPVQLVCDLSEKNPLRTLPHDATIVNLLEILSNGNHRVLIRSPSPTSDYLGIVSDRGLLAWLATYATRMDSLNQYLLNPLLSLGLPSLSLYSSVVAASAEETVLDAMKLMSEEGVSSIAVLDEADGLLLSAVSVTDIGHLVVPSQSNQILSMPLSQFVAQVKAPYGTLDGEDKYPVYSVSSVSDLAYTIQKLLATNAHRLFVTPDPHSAKASPTTSLANLPPTSTSNRLSGIVSIVDILSLFARLANIQDVDPTRMQRQRRESITSSSSGKRSRSSSRTGLKLARTNSGNIIPPYNVPMGVVQSPGSPHHNSSLPLRG